MLRWAAVVLAFLVGAFLVFRAFSESPLFALPGVAMMGAAVWYGARRSLLTQGVLELTWGSSILLTRFLAEQPNEGGSIGAGRNASLVFSLLLVGHGVYAIVRSRRATAAARDPHGS
ncbi:MAG: hypothetical protein ACKVWV_01385 [Planctomycetota bacterium]